LKKICQVFFIRRNFSGKGFLFCVCAKTKIFSAHDAMKILHDEKKVFVDERRKVLTVKKFVAENSSRVRKEIFLH